MAKQIGLAKVLMIATDGFEYTELTGPRDILTERGASVTVASPGSDPIEGESGGTPKGKITPDTTIDKVEASDFDALVLPGGQRNPDSLRLEEKVIQLVRDFDEQGKPVAAICHGPWLLIEAGIVDGKTMTGWPSIRTDLSNAGAEVVDREVAVDGNIITSRKPDDVPAFANAVIEAIEQARVNEPA